MKNGLIQYVSLIFFLLVPFLYSFAQNPSATTINNQVLAIEKTVDSSNGIDIVLLKAELLKLNALKSQFQSYNFPKDSVYARILHRIGLYEFWKNNNSATVNSINYTLEAIDINTSSSKGACKKFAVRSYYNMGLFYESLGLHNKAINYFDSALVFNQTFKDQYFLTSLAVQRKIDAYFKKGDYQKDAEECIFYINQAKSAHDSSNLPYYYNQLAQAFIYQNITSGIVENIDSAMHYAYLLKDDYELATSLKSKAILAAKNNKYSQADSLFARAIQARQQSQDAEQIGKDYIDYGNYFLDNRLNYNKAGECYFKAINFATKAKNNMLLAQDYVNIGQSYFRLHHLQEAENYYSKASTLLNISAPANFLKNASAAQLSTVYNKNLLIVLLIDKIELLLHFYKKEKNTGYLQATLQTAKLTDSVITQLRHEQIGEQSKLYWRNKTREFFTDAMEACYLNNDAEKAFYFMEESRAVLLSDKLEELGALSHIPAAETAKEKNLQTKIIEEQQKLLPLSPSSEAYKNEQIKYLTIKADLENYIQLLEQNYPAYYQYKYADSVTPLATLQQFLAKNHQSFIHYFMNDTVMYALGISANKTTLIKLSAKDFDSHQLAEFLNLCRDKFALNNHNDVYAALAQNIYKKIVEPLKLPPGNVAICTDNFLIPFEALCTDSLGKNYLLYHYNFSYVYSARSLMKPFTGSAASRNFIGFAPVTFSPNLQVTPLSQSAKALSKSAGFYNYATLFTDKQATRNNFFSNASNYAVINIFSHAQADTSEQEPRLYMQDAVIYLSELQLLKNPSAQFVLLSACQTNIGKAAAGEGIYSLARGFALAGIPAVSATLWNADEQTVYEISGKFNEYLAAGMRKDEALQKAKIWFIKTNSSSNLTLPYYWANMVLIGSSQPIVLAKENYTWLWLSGAIFIFILIIIAVLVKRKKTKSVNY